MGFVADLLGMSPPKVETPAMATPAQTTSVAQVEEDTTTARKDFYEKQALLAAKNSLVKTSPAGLASTSLQTAKKTLLGG